MEKTATTFKSVMERTQIIPAAHGQSIKALGTLGVVVGLSLFLVLLTCSSFYTLSSGFEAWAGPRDPNFGTSDNCTEGNPPNERGTTCCWSEEDLYNPGETVTWCQTCWMYPSHNGLYEYEECTDLTTPGAPPFTQPTPGLEGVPSDGVFEQGENPMPPGGNVGGPQDREVDQTPETPREPETSNSPPPAGDNNNGDEDGDGNENDPGQEGPGLGDEANIPSDGEKSQNNNGDEDGDGGDVVL